MVKKLVNGNGHNGWGNWVVNALFALLILGLGKWVDSLSRTNDALAAEIKAAQAIDSARSERLAVVETETRNTAARLLSIENKLDLLSKEFEALRRELIKR